MSAGSYFTSSRELAMIRRISQMSPTSPDALACSMMLPMAVPSCGPASTVVPVASAVNWFRYLFRLPPPMMCSTSILNGANS